MICKVPVTADTESLIAAVFCAAVIFMEIIIYLACCYQKNRQIKDYFAAQEQLWKRMSALEYKLKCQKRALREDFFLKLLYGIFNSEKQLTDAACDAGIVPPVGFCWYVADIEFEESEETSGEDDICGSSEFSDDTDEYLKEYILWNYFRYQARNFSAIILIWNSCELSPEELRMCMENFRAAVQCRYQVKVYSGISRAAYDLMEISKIYEAAVRMGEYAKYQKIDRPLLAFDIPENYIQDHPVVFPMDTEMKLMILIQQGCESQLNETISHLRSDFFGPGHSQYVYRYAIEILRNCLFHSISSTDNSEEVRYIRRKAEEAAAPEQLFELMLLAAAYFAGITEEKDEDTLPVLDKDKISDYIEEHFRDPALNLNMLAEWLDEPERRLYNEFKQSFGVSFSAYVEKRRMAYACRLLREGAAVKDIAEMSGYGSDYSFRRAFKRVVGIAPSDFKKIKVD